MQLNRELKGQKSLKVMSVITIVFGIIVLALAVMSLISSITAGKVLTALLSLIVPALCFFAARTLKKSVEGK
ncbi:MAG: hypothetical protein ACOX41_01930 [Anaerovoracaceae bacterium]|jgi:amino acid permease